MKLQAYRGTVFQPDRNWNAGRQTKIRDVQGIQIM